MTIRFYLLISANRLALSTDVASSSIGRRIWDGALVICGSFDGNEQMSDIDCDWLRDFDAAMLVFFAINHEEAGMDERELGWYADLPPKDAALAYGRDFDLCRVDTFWS